ncbi:MAG TPA: Gfo/Idh/MocA family oxidoreductase [Candidatus Binataceae bacterium]|nr:Gfo/Idh/MocA family oxidoreductase [Candidatus Binataceae bacterium]
MPSTLRIGTLGAARITPNALIKPAEQIDGVEVTAIAARDSRRAEEFAKANRIPRVLATYDDLISDPGIDIIYNPLPNSLHCEWTIRALHAGKHVLCEKPLASNAAEAERMAQAASASGRILGDAFHYCYHPLAARVRELISNGTLGKLVYVESSFAAPIAPPNIRYDWSLAGGATMDLGCYPLHMIRFFTGITPRVVRAAASTVAENIDVAMDVNMELGPGVTARMTCAMGKDVQFGASFIARGDRGEGKVVNPIAPHRGHQLTIKTNAGETQESVPGDPTYTYQLRAFADAVRGQGKFQTDGADGVVSMRIIDAVYRAAGLPPRGT